MKITNERNLPQIFMDAASTMPEENRSELHFSATTLIAPPRQVQLRKRHIDDTETDIVNWWYSFLGNAVHDKLEQSLSKQDKYLCEERIVIDSEGWKVGFKPDAFDKETNTLYDYKVATTFIRGLEMKPEWVQQINLYAYALRKAGYAVDNAHIIVLYKDWREASAKYKNENDYPKAPVVQFQVPLWTPEEQEEFFGLRLQEHIAVCDVPDEDLPECPASALWEKPAKYAVYKYGGDKATKLCDTMSEAESYIKWKKLNNHGIEFRPGERVRCNKYCDAAPFCNQYQTWLKEQENKTAEAIGYDAVVSDGLDVQHMYHKYVHDQLKKIQSTYTD